VSTIKSADEHLTLNADGSSKNILFQADGVQKASISSAGLFTSTTIDATVLTGNLPAISGASLTALNATNLGSGTVPAARLGNSLVKISQESVGDVSQIVFDSSDITTTYKTYLVVFDGLRVAVDGTGLTSMISANNGSSYFNS
jgi:uncharacterized Zn-binding protein involved in type VI secretion